MIIPANLRQDIANRIIRTIAPALIIAASLAIMLVLSFGPEHKLRLLPAIAAIALALLSWFCNRRGHQDSAILLLIASPVSAVLLGMTFNGGVQAPVFVLNLAILILIVVFYGLRGGIVFSLLTLLLGSIYVFLAQTDALPAFVPAPPLFWLLHYFYIIPLTICFILIPVRLLKEALLASEQKSQELEEAIARRKRTEEELQSILSKTPDIIYRLDDEGHITYINEAITRFGYTPEQLLGKSLIDLVHPTEQEAVRRRLNERRTGNRRTAMLELRLRLGFSDSNNQETGEYATMHIFSDGLYADGVITPGTFLGTQGIARDISPLRRMEEQVTFLASVVEQAAEDVVITDTAGIIRYVNPTFEKVTGYTAKEVLGKTPNILRSGHHSQEFYQEIWSTISRGETWKGQIWNQTKDKQKLLQDVTITPITDHQDRISGYASIRRDITRQTEIENHLRQAQKMEAIGTLAGGIAHDFNNILAGIIGYAELARAETEETPAIQQKIDNVLKAGNRASELVRQILSFSRSQAVTPKSVEPAAIAEEVLKLLRASLPATIEIRSQLHCRKRVFADPTNIHQVLMNLCTNASQAMKDGGILSVTVEEWPGAPMAPRNRQPGGQYLAIHIGDTGHGIPEELHEKIFDPFFTTKALGKGTGMGLSVVHSIVRELGGSIDLQSIPGEGTVFSVILPVLDEQEQQEAVNLPAQLGEGSERILFVDDEEMQAALAREALGRRGYSITTFTNSREALEHLAAHPDDFDLLITDLTMPGMTGDQLVKEVRALLPHLPVIMCTGFSETMNGDDDRLAEVDALLHKPVIIGELLTTMRRLLDTPDS